MPSGGARPGAGRRKGTGIGPKPITAVRKAIAERLITENDLSPLEVMVEAMNAAREAGNMREAAGYANMAAPYVHPRLSSINSTHSGTVQLNVVTNVPERDAD